MNSLETLGISFFERLTPNMADYERRYSRLWTVLLMLALLIGVSDYTALIPVKALTGVLSVGLLYFGTLAAVGFGWYAEDKGNLSG